MSYVIIGIMIIISVMLHYISKGYLKDGYKLLNPINILLIIWNVALVFHLYLFGSSNESFTVYIIVGISLIGCCIAFLAGTNVNVVINHKYNYNRGDYFTYDQRLLRKNLRFFTLCQMVNVFMSLLTMYRLTGGRLMLLVSNATYIRNMYLARNEGLAVNIVNVIISIHCLLGYVALGIYCAKKFNKWKLYLFVWTSLVLGGALITMSKMTFFIYIIIVVTAFVNASGSIKVQSKVIKKVLPPVVGILLLLLVLIGMQRNYQTGGETMLKFTLDRAVFYFTSPIEALSLAIKQYPSEWGIVKNTFTLVYKFFARVGVLQNVSITNHLFTIETSYGSTNVYSWLWEFYQDLSYIGMIIYPMIFSLFAGLVYSKGETRFGRASANAFVAALFAMSFYGLLWTQGTYFYALIYAYIYDSLFLKRLYINEGKLLS